MRSNRYVSRVQHNVRWLAYILGDYRSYFATNIVGDMKLVRVYTAALIDKADSQNWALQFEPDLRINVA